MVDVEHLISWPLDRIVTARGFVCERCGDREAISYSNSSLEEALRQLTRVSAGDRYFGHYFGKALAKAEAINRRMVNGSLKCKNMASSGPLG